MDQPGVLGDLIGYLYTWWRGDPLPSLPAPSGFHAERTCDERLIGRLSRLSQQDIRSRIDAGHQPYVAFLGVEAAGLGWSATRQASIGELGTSFFLPETDRYLWDFVTLAPWRGRGVYPHLLQSILRIDDAARRFWIGHDWDNEPSARGILRAGFRRIGQVHHLRGGGLGFVPIGHFERARAGAALLGLPLFHDAADRGR